MHYAALVKQKTSETYLWIWDDDPKSRLLLVQTLGVMAADPELSMDFMDSDRVLKHVLELEQRHDASRTA